MGFLAEVLSFTRSVIAGAKAPETKVTRGGNDTLTAYHFSAPGDDSQPLPGDVAYVGIDTGQGNAQALGYQDPQTEPVAGPGEKRIYSRSGPGALAADIWLGSDGAIRIENEQASVEVKADGAIRIGNEKASFEIKADGAMILKNGFGSIELDVAGKINLKTPTGSYGFDTHIHSVPAAPGVSAPPTVGV